MISQLTITDPWPPGPSLHREQFCWSVVFTQSSLTVTVSHSSDNIPLKLFENIPLKIKIFSESQQSEYDLNKFIMPRRSTEQRLRYFSLE